MKNDIKKEEKVKKMNINMTNNSMLSEIGDFYNKNLKKKHIILSIITIVLFIIYFIYMIISYKSGNITMAEGVTPDTLKTQIYECFLLSAVIIIAGITPYFYLSVIGVFVSIDLVSNMFIRYVLGYSSIPTLLIGGIIQLICYSLCIAIGLYYCKLSTKKNKYYHYSDFSFNDIKKQVYEIRKDEKKVKEMEEKKEAKRIEAQKSNVKIPYLKFIVLGLASFAFECIGVLIALI